MHQRLQSFDELEAALRALPQKVAVVGHARPDGDCVGAAVGMIWVLKSLGKDVFGMTPDAVPEYLRPFLEGTAWREPDMSLLKDTAVVAVDVPNGGRLGGDFVVNVALDHHESHVSEPYAEKYYVDPLQTSASQMVATLAQKLKLQPPKNIASAMYAGILTDTIGFMVGSSNTGLSDAHEAANWLLRQGVDALAINQTMMMNTTRSYLKLQSFLLSRAEYLADGKLILIGVKQSEIDAIGATDEDRTKLGNFFVSIDGVEMSAFIREENGACKGSLRARDERYRADLLGQKFGGGGHKKASGIGGPGLNEALETFLPRFRGEFVRHWGVYGQVSR